MHSVLFSFLTDIWTNADVLIFGPHSASEKEAVAREGVPTLENRIYERYLLAQPDNTDTSALTAGIEELKSKRLSSNDSFRYEGSQKGVFARFEQKGVLHGDYRVYFNPEMTSAVQLVKLIFQVGRQHRPLPPIPTRAPHNVAPQAPVNSILVNMVKIVEAKEARSGRPDRVVAYVPGSAG